MADVPRRPAEQNADDVDAEVIDVEVVDEDEVPVADAVGSDVEAGASARDVDDLDASEQALAEDIERLIAERDQYLDHLKRVQADYENHVKRTHKRLKDMVEGELGDVIERLLPVLDACDAAAAQGESDAVEPIVTQLYGALQKEGLERIDPKGDLFDPEVAEAVAHEPGEGGEQVVSEVMRTGYRWKGRVLRPALVKVTD